VTGSVLPTIKRKNTITKLPVRGFIDLTYTGTLKRSISARTGTVYSCIPSGIIKACDVDVEGLISLGYFKR